MQTIAVVVCLLIAGARAGGPPFNPAEWTLDFEDEFDGSALNTTNWTPKTGIHTDQEGEWYLPENVAVENGNLILTASLSDDPSKTGGLKYTSGWVDTATKWAALGGRFEASCKFYVGAGGNSQGYWPAYWLMPETTTCWPVAGEIDIMESLGGAASPYGGHAIGEQESHWDLHYSKTCGQGGSVGNFTTPLPLSGPLFNETFAIFGVNFDYAADEMTFYLNDTTVGTHHGFNELISGPNKWHHILNYAVGGPWGGFPDKNTVFPSTMQCDFVRHFAPSS